jgi:hypothetical protein
MNSSLLVQIFPRSCKNKKRKERKSSVQKYSEEHIWKTD